MQIRKLVRDNLIVRKTFRIHSRTRARLYKERTRKGRHCGRGKRHGTREARMPTAIIWMRRQRALRRLLKKYRTQRKIDKHQYHSFYLACKGNQYKNKSVLIEAIQTDKKEKSEELKLKE
jgi:large subunit ribosomal protein L19e